MVKIVDKLTRSFVILAIPLVRLVEQSAKQKVVNPVICAAYIYDCVLIIAICGQREEVLGSELEILKVLVICQSSLGNADARKVLERPVLLCEFD